MEVVAGCALDGIGGSSVEGERCSGYGEVEEPEFVVECIVVADTDGVVVAQVGVNEGGTIG